MATAAMRLGARIRGSLGPHEPQHGVHIQYLTIVPIWCVYLHIYMDHIPNIWYETVLSVIPIWHMDHNPCFGASLVFKVSGPKRLQL